MSTESPSRSIPFSVFPGACALMAVLTVASTWPSPVLGRGGWPDLPYVYSYEADDGEAQGASAAALDGTWNHDNGSDQWDGSTPEPGDGNPGGVEILDLPGEAEDGGDASVLSMEDTGDPRSQGAAEPSNRKFYLTRGLVSEGIDLATGVTMVARWRLNPEPKAPEILAPNGTTLHDGGKGQVGFGQRSAGGGIVTAAMSFALTDTGNLQFAFDWGNDNNCAGAFWPTEFCFSLDDPEEWVTVWMTAIEEVPGEVQCKVYINRETDPVLDTDDTGPLLGLPTGFEGPDASYVQVGMGSTPQIGAIQIDYVSVADGFNEPEELNPNCPGGLTVTGEGGDLLLRWTNGAVTPASVDVLRDDVVIGDDVPADPPSFTDVAPPPGLHTYQLGFNVPGQNCGSLALEVDTCPQNLTATADFEGVHLNWTAVIDYDGVIIMRDDDVLVADHPGDSTSFLDTDPRKGETTYTVQPSNGDCTPLEVTVTNLRAPLDGNFDAETLQWDYELDPPVDADPARFLQHNPLAGELGDLDGLWTTGNGSDSWDGSAPGEVGDPGVDPASASPGGIGLVNVDGYGAYFFEDTGNPTGQGWVDPSNRKLYLGYDMADMDDDAALNSNLIGEGITFRTRFRLPETGVDSPGALPDGTFPGFGGKGMFTLVHDGGITAAGPSMRVGIAMDVNPDGGGILRVGEATGNGSEPIDIIVDDPTEWLDVWLVAEDADDDPLSPELQLRIFLNGSVEPTVDTTWLPPDGGLEGSSGVNPSGNFLYMGFPSTADAGAMEVDFVSLVLDAQAPTGGGEEPTFKRGDSDASGVIDISDPIWNLTVQFVGGGASFVCVDAADVDDSGVNDISDPIYSLTFQFIGGIAPPPAPGTTSCGPDPTADGLDCEAYPQEKC